MTDYESSELPSGWRRLASGEKTRLELELQRELPQGHVLKGITVRALAMSQEDCDDIAFITDDNRLCIVHLTWKAEEFPDWPFHVFVSELH